MAIQKLPLIAKDLDSKTSLTFYSLYKQVNEGGADDLPDNESSTAPVK
jgi:hypothetical protein